jgi:hypothetical protein
LGPGAAVRAEGRRAIQAPGRRVSRIYVGCHFRDAVEKGLVHGRKIADWTVRHALQPFGKR